MVPVILFYMTLILCAALTGVFWFMHVAYYPAFSYIGQEQWPAFFKKRYQNTAMVVYPMMTFETLANLALFFMMLRHKAYAGFSLATFLLLGIWGWHFLFMNRAMENLNQNREPEAMKKVLIGSLVRAGGYTFRLLVLVGTLL